jgi:hypothetical protein
MGARLVWRSPQSRACREPERSHTGDDATFLFGSSPDISRRPFARPAWPSSEEEASRSCAGLTPALTNERCRRRGQGEGQV